MASISFPASAMAQQGLEVVLSCPLYEPGPPTLGNDPSLGLLHQPRPMSYQAGEQGVCQIFYGNSAGAPIEDVTLSLRFPAARQVPVVSASRLPGGNPLDAARGFQNVFTHQDVLVSQAVAAPGFFEGSFDAAAQRYDWQLGRVEAGTSGQLRVLLALEPTSYVNDTLSLQVSSAQGLAPARTVPTHYAGGVSQYEIVSLAPLFVDPTLGFVGAKHLLHRATLGEEHRDMTMVVELPYWNGTAVVADGGYDVTDPLHRPLHRPEALEAELVLDDEYGVARLAPGEVAAPRTGANAGRILRYDTAHNRLLVELGSIDDIAEVRWSAPLASPVVEGMALPHRACWSSAHQPTSQCGAAVSSVTGAEPAHLPFTFYQGLSYSPSGPLVTNGVTEQSALSSHRADFSQFVDVANPSSFPLSNYELVLQAPGDQDQKSDFVSASWGDLRFFSLDAGQAIYVSTTPTTYGSPNDLSLRVVPTTPTSAWRRCDDALGAPSSICDRARLAALGISPAQVSEVRFFTPTLPSRAMSGTSPLRTGGALERVEVTWRLRDTVVDSLDGTTSYDANTLDGRSLGNLATLRWNTPAGLPQLARLTRSAEVDTRNVDALLATHGVGPDDWQTPIAPKITSSNHAAYWGMRLYNEGSLANVFGPFELSVRLPEGFEPNATAFFPNDPLRPRVRVGTSNGRGGTSWSWNSNAVRLEYSFDPTTREYLTTITPLQPDAALSPIKSTSQNPAPAAGLVGDLIVTVHGEILIGAPRSLRVGSPVLRASVVEDGKVIRKEIPLKEGEFDVSSVAPALSLSLAASPALIGALQEVRYDLSLFNSAYRDDGALRPGGATGSARELVLYQRVTRAGDHPTVEQGRGASVFVRAPSGGDVSEVWISTKESPPRHAASALRVNPSGEWRRCSVAPVTCDATALAALNLTPAQVRWVGFTLDEVLVTDAAPRGVAPRKGATRQDRPYRATLFVADDASNQNAIIRATSSLTTIDATSIGSEFVDVRVDAACHATLPNVGFDQPERCDGIDNDCDGVIDEGFTIGTLCQVSFDACSVEGVHVCSPDGLSMRCDVSSSPDTDTDGYPDACDCAPHDPAHYDVRPGSPTSCDQDGDGECAAHLTRLNGALCPYGVSDCRDTHPGFNSMALELCDEEDNDCDGEVDEGFSGIGQACSNGYGVCRRQGVAFCGADGLSVSCDAVPGTPALEACDGVDNDCDGQIDEDYQTLGQVCEVGFGVCAAPGVQVCSPDGRHVRCEGTPLAVAEPESCDGVDNDCDGQIDEDFEIGELCQVSFPGGCQAEGAWTCDMSGEALCVINEPLDQDRDGFPDVCDCAPLDATHDTLAAGSPRSCDWDGDGHCDIDIPDLSLTVCDAPLDCNDAVAVIHPGAPELCDDRDNDCDLLVDEDFTTLGQSCAAGEGPCRNEGEFVCAANATSVRCSAVAGQVGAPELCDGNDNDCDGQVDEDFVNIPNGLGSSCEVEYGGCPLQGVRICDREQPTLLICKPSTPRDFDEDGVPDACDCAPHSALYADLVPGSSASCDKDEDGWCDAGIVVLDPTLCPQRGDCDDAEVHVYPGAPEVCDGIDADCDGDADEALYDLGLGCTVGVGACARDGFMVCAETGEGAMCGVNAGEPQAELCNGIDDDCDGEIDEAFALGVACEIGEGQCLSRGVTVCDEETGGVRCDATERDEGSDELCNGIDDDCDGQIDEAFALGERCVTGLGICQQNGVLVCDLDQVGTVCEPTSDEIVFPLEELCNGLDDDCDGEVDEGLDGCDPPVVPELPEVVDPGSEGGGVLMPGEPCDPSQEGCEPEPRHDYAIYGTGFCDVGGMSGRGDARGGVKVGILLMLLGILSVGRRRRERHVTSRRGLGMSVGVMALLAASPGDVMAQQQGGSLSTQQFRPAPGGAYDSLNMLTGVGTPGHLESAFGLYTNYGLRPLVVQDRVTGEEQDVVRHQVQSDLALSLGVGERLELGMVMPVVLYQRGDTLWSTEQGLPGEQMSAQALGDLRLSLKLSLFGSLRRGLNAGVMVVGGVPTGSGASLQSDAVASVEPRALMTWIGPKGGRLSANVGYVWRQPGEVLNVPLGAQLSYALGAAKPLGRGRVELTSEIYGRASLVGDGVDVAGFPAEISLGGRLRVGQRHLISLSGGPGLTRGYGTPTARLIAGYRFVPASSVVGHGWDSDRDGLLDDDDLCVDEMEDLDGFQDDDGCPDPDNDRDEIPDVLDACPNDPEDYDGYRDLDGCPDPDNDRDAILDVDDACPTDAEDHDGFEDEDGCPEPDNDQDGILDGEDQCLMEPEDFDGFQDADGCPDPDNDHDGILDRDDQCPEEQEIYNDFEDEDGCPDHGRVGVEWTWDRIMLPEEIYFDTDRAKIQERSRKVLRDLAEFLMEHPEIELVEIQGHTDDRGTEAWNMDLSWRRAQSVRRHLIKRGIAPERLVIEGYGKVRPIEEGVGNAERARNRRVEFRILLFEQ